MNQLVVTLPQFAAWAIITLLAALCGVLWWGARYFVTQVGARLSSIDASIETQANEARKALHSIRDSMQEETARWQERHLSMVERVRALEEWRHINEGVRRGH